MANLVKASAYFYKVLSNIIENEHFKIKEGGSTKIFIKMTAIKFLPENG